MLYGHQTTTQEGRFWELSCGPVCQTQCPNNNNNNNVFTQTQMLLSAALLFFSGFCSWHVPLRCMLHELPDEPIGVSLLALGMPAPEDTRAYTSFLI
jgi:hypothetical protein